jgi:hypothetical protein
LSLHAAILQEQGLVSEKPLLYHVRPSRSHVGAFAVMDGRQFLTGSYSLLWAVQYAETLASFDRRRGIDADVVVVSSEATGEGAC